MKVSCAVGGAGRKHRACSSSVELTGEESVPLSLRRHYGEGGSAFKRNGFERAGTALAVPSVAEDLSEADADRGVRQHGYVWLSAHTIFPKVVYVNAFRAARRFGTTAHSRAHALTFTTLCLQVRVRCGTFQVACGKDRK